MSYPLASTDSLAAEHGSRKKLATVRVAVNLKVIRPPIFLSRSEHLQYCAIADYGALARLGRDRRIPRICSGMGDAIMKLADKLLPSN